MGTHALPHLAPLCCLLQRRLLRPVLELRLLLRRLLRQQRWLWCVPRHAQGARPQSTRGAHSPTHAHTPRGQTHARVHAWPPRAGEHLQPALPTLIGIVSHALRDAARVRMPALKATEPLMQLVNDAPHIAQFHGLVANMLEVSG